MLFRNSLFSYEKARYVFYIIISSFIVMSNILFPHFIYRISSNVILSTHHIVSVLGMPADLISKFAKNISSSILSYNKLEEVKAENEVLKTKIAEQETELLNFKEYKILFDSLKEKQELISLLHTIRITKGEFELVFAKSTKEVYRNDIVLDDSGLIGRVIDYGQENQVAKIQLLTDYKFKIPAMTLNSLTYGVAVGNGNSTSCPMKLIHRDKNIAIAEGEIVATSGEFDLSPKGILIGKISKIDGKTVCIEPLAKVNHINNLIAIKGVREG